MADEWKTSATAKEIVRFETKKIRGERHYSYEFRAIHGESSAKITEFHYEKLRVPDVTSLFAASEFVDDRLADAMDAMTMRDKVDYNVWFTGLRNSGAVPPISARLAWLRARSREASKALKTSVVEAMESHLDRDNYRAKMAGRIEAIPGWQGDERLARMHKRVGEGRFLTFNETPDIDEAERRRAERNGSRRMGKHRR